MACGKSHALFIKDDEGKITARWYDDYPDCYLFFGITYLSRQYSTVLKATLSQPQHFCGFFVAMLRLLETNNIQLFH